MKQLFLSIILILLSIAGYSQKQINGKTPARDVNLSVADYSNGIPDLVATAEFVEPSGNNLLDAEETAQIKVKITNNGTNSAFDVGVNVSVDNNKNLSFNVTNKYFGEIPPGKTVTAVINITARQSIQNTTRKFNISFTEHQGFIARPISYEIQTQKFLAPKLTLVETGIEELRGNKNNKIEQGELILASVLIQNQGQGTALNSRYEFTGFTNALIATLTNDYPLSGNLGDLAPGESRTLQFAFSATWNYTETDIPLKIKLTESRGTYGGTYDLGLEMNVQQLATVDMKKQGEYQKHVDINNVSLVSDVDKNIPENQQNSNRFALIVGNENYKYLAPLTDAFTINDAKVFRQYAEKTLGVPANNVYYITDATDDDLNTPMPNSPFSKMLKRLNSNSEVFVYYSGHGIADNDGNGYFLPVNANIVFNEQTKKIDIIHGIKIQDFLDEIGRKNPKLLVVFTDACFSGADKSDASISQAVAKTGMKQIKKANKLPDNTIYFSATSDASPAYPFTDQKHGLFTYSLLKSIQKSNGKITYQQLFTDISNEMNNIVNGASFNFKADQTPTIKTTKNGWQNLQLVR